MAVQQPIDDMALTTYEQPRNTIIVRPLVRPADMIAAIQEYEALKTAILLPKDVQVISGKTHIKKSGWLRIARAFGLTVEPVSCVYVPDPTGGDDWGYEVVARAIAPNGASMSGDGACWATEKIVKPRGWNGKPPTEADIHKAAEKTLDMQTRHNVRAHAFTRATNRAISNLVGGGEVSAEELGDYIDAEPASPVRPAPAPTRPAPRSVPASAPVPVVTHETPIAYKVEEAPVAQLVDESEPIRIDVVEEIRKFAETLPTPDWHAIKRKFRGRSNEELLVHLQELADAKADGFPLDGPAQATRKAAQG